MPFEMPNPSSAEQKPAALPEIVQNTMKDPKKFKVLIDAIHHVEQRKIQEFLDKNYRDSTGVFKPDTDVEKAIDEAFANRGYTPDELAKELERMKAEEAK